MYNRVIALLIGISVCSAPDDAHSSPHAFAQDLSERMRALVFDAAAINPLTLREDRNARRQQLKEQRRLKKWFREHGYAVRYADLDSDADRANYDAYPTVMANADFLQRRFRERKRFATTIADYMSAFAGGFEPSLRRFADGELGHFTTTTASPIRLKARFFSHNSRTGTAAVYLPGTQTIYLNLNLGAESPNDLLDAFEHELWHHLLPIVSPANLVDNLWWEGYTEVVGELWGHDLHQLTHGEAILTRSVEYPVQAAFVSLYLGLDRASTLRYLVSGDQQQYRAAFLASGHGSQAPLRETLLRMLTEAAQMDAARQQQCEDILGDWGWKEDDGSQINISGLLEDGQLDRRAVAREFRIQKRLLMDLIQAMTVINLQDLKPLLTPAVRAELRLPEHLRKNLTRVMRYVKNPYHQLANR